MMDMRVKKTKRSIINAFLELRSKMPLEKIRINELCRIAEINKSTFYAHYQDVYQLSEEVEQEVLQSYLNIPHPEYVLCNTEGFVRELFQAFYAHERLFHILFSGSRSSVLTEKIAEGIRELILRQYPQYSYADYLSGLRQLLRFSGKQRLWGGAGDFFDWKAGWAGF